MYSRYPSIYSSRDVEEEYNAIQRKLHKEYLKNKLLSISRIDVPEDNPIFATCDDVRRMIELFLTTTELSTYAFARAIGASDQSVGKFLQQAGEKAGLNSIAYRKAWRFFEQLRIYEMKDKSAVRLSDEAKWGPNGFHKYMPKVKEDIGPPSKRRKARADVGEPEADDTVI